MAYDTDDLIRDGNDAILGDGQQFTNVWIRWGFFIFFLSLLYCWFGMSVTEFRQNVVHEVTSTQTVMTEVQSQKVLSRVGDWYRVAMVDSHVSETLDRLYIKPKKQNLSGTLISGMTERLVDNTKLWVYRSILRINVLFEWLMIGAVLIFAFVGDAYYDYRKRAESFGQQNVKVAAIAMRLMGVSLFSLWIFLVVPMVDGSLWRYLPVAFIVLTIILSTTLVRQFQRF